MAALAPHVIVDGTLKVAQPTHVVIDRVPKSEGDPEIRWQTMWIGFGAIASALAAFATVFLALLTFAMVRKTAALAGETKRMADETAALAKETNESIDAARDANRLADQHHQEALLPLVYVDAAAVIRSISSPLGTGWVAFLEGKVENIGNGPALSVDLRFTPNGYEPRTFRVGLIGAKSSRGLVGVSIPLGTTQNHSNETKWPFSVKTEYASMFGSHGSIEQSSHSGEAKDLITVHEEYPEYAQRVTAATAADRGDNKVSDLATAGLS